MKYICTTLNKKLKINKMEKENLQLGVAIKSNNRNYIYYETDTQVFIKDKESQFIDQTFQCFLCYDGSEINKFLHASFPI